VDFSPTRIDRLPDRTHLANQLRLGTRASTPWQLFEPHSNLSANSQLAPATAAQAFLLE